METMITIFWQAVTMVLLAGVGFVMFRAGKITKEGSKTLGNLLIYLALPCIIINGFLVERTAEHITGLLVSTVVSVVALGLSMAISRLFLGRHAIDNFGCSFANPGFFGIPLIAASVGAEGVFYVAPFVACLNMLQWTYGVSLLENSDENGIVQPKTGKATVPFKEKAAALGKRLVKAPFMVAIFIGLFFFFTGLPMPELIGKCITTIAGINTPIAMFTIGIYMAQTDVLKMFTRGRLYRLSLVRLVVIPAVSLALIALLPSSMNAMKMAMVIATACPVGSNVAVYAQLHNRDYPYAVETVVISTLLSIVTVPLIAGLAGMLF